MGRANFRRAVLEVDLRESHLYDILNDLLKRFGSNMKEEAPAARPRRGPRTATIHPTTSTHRSGGAGPRPCLRPGLARSGSVDRGCGHLQRSPRARSPAP